MITEPIRSSAYLFYFSRAGDLVFIEFNAGNNRRKNYAIARPWWNLHNIIFFLTMLDVM